MGVQQATSLATGDVLGNSCFLWWAGRGNLPGFRCLRGAPEPFLDLWLPVALQRNRICAVYTYVLRGGEKVGSLTLHAKVGLSLGPEAPAFPFAVDEARI